MSAGHFSKRLKKELPLWLLREPLEKLRPLLSQALTYRLEVDALRLIEKHERIQELIFKGNAQDSQKSALASSGAAERQRVVRSFYLQFLMRAGHYGLARQLTTRFSDGSAEALFRQALLAFQFWDFEGCRAHLVQAVQRVGATPEMHIFRHQMEARCRLVARKNVDEIPLQLAEVERWLPRVGNEDLAGAVTVRYADVLGMSGRNREALALSLEKAAKIEDRIRTGLPTTQVHLAELYIGASRYSFALGQGRDLFLSYMDRSLELSKDERDNYPLMLAHLFDSVRAFADTGMTQRFLRSLQGHLPGFDPDGHLAHVPGIPQRFAGEPTSDLRTLKEGVRLKINLATDEYRFADEATPRLGCPLEVRLVAWLALASPVVSMPRTLLIDLLWPDMPAQVIYLQDRLSKLLLRAERLYGFNLRSGLENDLRLSSDDLARIEVLVGAPGEVPSFFQGEANPTARLLGHYYGLSKSQASVWMAHAREAGWVQDRAIRSRDDKEVA